MISPSTSIRLIFCSIILALSIPSILEAYPYAYRRLVLERDGKVEKVVELISDLPIPEIAMANPKKFNLHTTLQNMFGKISRSSFESQNLSPLEQNELIIKTMIESIEMGPSEKSLVAALRKIGSHGADKIEFFSEVSQMKFSQIGGELSKYASRTMLSIHIANVLMQESSDAKNRNLICSQIDGLFHGNETYTAHMRPTPVFTQDDYARFTFEKIMESEHSHIIVYGGGSYCKKLNDLLIETNYQLKKSIGTEHDGKLESMEFIWKVIRHAPLVAIYRLIKALERMEAKLNQLDKNARAEEEKRIFNALFEKQMNPKAKVQVDNDSEIILISFEKIVRRALHLHRDVTQMIPPLSPKTWKHLGS